MPDTVLTEKDPSKAEIDRRKVPISVDSHVADDFLLKIVDLIDKKRKKLKINAYTISREAKLSADTLYRFFEPFYRGFAPKTGPKSLPGQVKFSSAIKIALAMGLKVTFSDPDAENAEISMVLSKD